MHVYQPGELVVKASIFVHTANSRIVCTLKMSIYVQLGHFFITPPRGQIICIKNASSWVSSVFTSIEWPYLTQEKKQKFMGTKAWFQMGFQMGFQIKPPLL